MAKRIIQQARGKGSLTYRVRRKAFSHKIAYPSGKGEAEILSMIHSAGHTSPLMKLKLGKEIAFVPAFNGAVVGEKVQVTPEKSSDAQGTISFLKDIPTGTQVYNIERNPGDGGKMMRAAGSSALVLKKQGNKTILTMPNKKEVTLNNACRATIGTPAGDGRLLKPFIKAGRKYYKMKARSKLWPKISAVAVNAVDHPFGSGRGKRVKSKIAKRNAPPGKRVGHLRPKRTGYRG